jgi:hypothetical protein
MFKDTISTTTFTLVTSWIPGEGHKGMFRYKLDSAPIKPAYGTKLEGNIDYDDPDVVEKFVQRIHKCTFFLQLYDSDGFLLRTITVDFINTIDGSGRIVGLSANSSTQMDADEYKKLVGNSILSGSYNILWVDPKSQ